MKQQLLKQLIYYSTETYAPRLMYYIAAKTTSFAIRKTGSLVQTAGNQNMTNPIYLGI